MGVPLSTFTFVGHAYFHPDGSVTLTDGRVKFTVPPGAGDVVPILRQPRRPGPAPGGRGLRVARLAAGLSGSALAEKLGMSQAWVSKVECGHIALDEDRLHAWTTACGVDPEELGAVPNQEEKS